MKTPVVAGIVVGVHCLVIGSVVLLQGCRTTTAPKKETAPPPMPPAVVAPAETHIQPLPPPVAPEPMVGKPEAAAGAKTYEVQSGDSLASIAHRFKTSVKEIADLNSIKNPNKVRVGQKLQMPDYVDLSAVKAPAKHKAAKTAVAAKGVKGKAAPAVAGAGEYIVKSGDTLGKIAKKEGTTVKALKEVNKLTSNTLKAGQKLVLPAGKGEKAAPAAAESAPATAPAEQVKAEVEGAPAMEATPAAPGAAPAAAVPYVHTVAADQSMSEIAMMYGISKEDLMKLNGLTNETVHPGQTIKIPAANLQ